MGVWVVGKKGLVGSYLAPSSLLATTKEEVDLLDQQSIEQTIHRYPQIDCIINAAAFSSVDLAEKEKELAYQVNVVGAENLAKAAFSRGIDLIHLSTDYVFSSEKKEEIVEEAPFSFCNYYGFTKAEGEKKVRACHPLAIILRTSWIFGGSGSNFASKLFQMLMEKEELFLRDDQLGKLTYLPDLKGAIDQLIEKGKRGEVYHFANQGVTSRYQFALAMQKMLEEKKVEIKTKKIHQDASYSSIAKRPFYSALSTNKMEQLIGPIPFWRQRLEEFLCEK